MRPCRVCYNGQHSTAGEGIGRSLKQEATREQQSTTILIETAFRVDAQCTGSHWLGCIAINVRSEYSSTLPCQHSPRRRRSWPFGRCHRTLCWGQGSRPATRNHPRSCNDALLEA